MKGHPHVVIVGRANVGKSTLFNRLCGRRRALVGNEPGMTRDRLYAPAEWCGKPFIVVDTGGLLPGDREVIAREIFRQAQRAIDEAAQLILVVDARQGLLPLDEELAQLLRRTGRPLALAVNKTDSIQHAPLAAEFHRLGIAPVFPVSAEHGLGVDDLLDHVTRDFTAEGAPAYAKASAGTPSRALASEGPPGRPPHPQEFIRVAILGRPNVGKSTLMNRLVNDTRSIVTVLPGTTRDAVEAEFEQDGLRFLLVDTAGIRRKGKTKLLAEKLSVIQARKHLERADVALLMLDACEGVTALDTHIGGYAHESGRSTVVTVNKWDAVAKGPTSTRDYTALVRRRMKYLDYAPIVFISALTGQRLGKLVSTIAQVAFARQHRVSSEEMRQFLEAAHLDSLPGTARKPLRIHELQQWGVGPPTFVALMDRPAKVHFSVERYLENRLREKFGFPGTPIVIRFRATRRRRN